MKKIVILMLFCTLFLSCEKISKSIDETLKPNDTIVNKKSENVASPPLKSEKKEINLLTNIEILKKAEEQLKNLPQYNGKEIFIYSILYFYNDGRINAMLQHPENPKYVDIYEFNDEKWSGPKPVQLSVRDDVKGRLVSLNKISFINAAKLAQVYNEKTKEVEGAQPTTSVYISIWNNKLRWYPSSISGSREHYSIEFNDDGSLKSFQQD
ncbi:hypothetical protein [Flavobacterium sp. UBA4854]|uniref:hypothetical protein n=1 Tax=Flavobacterium sp. UBA4854 TaxID=1946548 RepID=UPI00257FA386|nr:hypothetical protein [Flavobacterium sp. UBA4854]